jgi:hypothetical protein
VTTHRDSTNRHLLIALAALLLTLAATFAFSAATADRASAQVPAICDEYPGLPQCEQGSGGGGGGGGANPTSGAGQNGIPGGGGATADDTGGTLPFTGYPLTPLLLLLLVLLAAGLTIRAYLAIRDRLRARDSGTPTGTA